MRFVLPVVVFASFLSACGGGASGPLPSTAPSTAPQTYAAHLVFVGSMARSVQSDLRQAQSLEPMTSGTPIPIMVVSAPESGANVSQYGGQVEAVVSPEPSSSPTVSFANTNPDAVLASPAPTSLPAGIVGEAIVTGSNAVQSQVAGNASATIGAPVNQTPTAPVYSYMSIALDEPGSTGIAGSGYTMHVGWMWANGTWSPDDDTTTADIYIDSSGTIYVPGGDTRISTDTVYSSIAASQWANTETSFTLVQAITQNPDGSNNGLVIGKTRSGAIFKLFPNAIGQGSGYFGAIEVSGSSIDGF